MKIIAKAFWNVDELPPEVAMLVAIRSREFGWYLPTELVITKPGYYTPKSASYWVVWSRDCETLLKLAEGTYPRFKEDNQSKTANSMRLVEIYGDYLDDGHVYPCLTAYALITAEDLEAYLAYKSVPGYNSGDEAYVVPPVTHCYSCDTDSPSEQWVKSGGRRWDVCPLCGAF